MEKSNTWTKQTTYRANEKESLGIGLPALESGKGFPFSRGINMEKQFRVGFNFLKRKTIRNGREGLEREGEFVQ